MTHTQADTSKYRDISGTQCPDAGVNGSRERWLGSGSVNHVPGAKNYPECQWQPGITESLRKSAVRQPNSFCEARQQCHRQRSDQADNP
jgi:hypothetical protein